MWWGFPYQTSVVWGEFVSWLISPRLKGKVLFTHIQISKTRPRNCCNHWACCRPLCLLGKNYRCGFLMLVLCTDTLDEYP